MARFAIRDVVCPEGHVEKSAYCHLDEEGFPMYPQCANETCHRPTTEWYGDGGAPAVHVFKTIVYDGVEYNSQEEWNRYLRGVAQNQMVDPSKVVVTGNDEKARKVQAEEAQHRGWATRRKHGIDDQQLADHRRAQKQETGRVFGPRR